MIKNVRRICVRISSIRGYSTASKTDSQKLELEFLGQKYPRDHYTNITAKIARYLGRNLHTVPNHPLSHVRQRITDYFYKAFPNRLGNPVFSIHDNLRPIVTVEQNFDSLLVPKDHPSRSKSDCYYINSNTLLRAHTTAHQSELISMGLNNFIVIGDVYRRDDVNATHYPVFHQADAVRLQTQDELFQGVENSVDLKIFEHRGSEDTNKQGCHTLEATKIMEHELKTVLTGLVQALFGKDIKYRWVEEFFPFTHPSWELEIKKNEQWIEILGCGIMRQEILQRSGAGDRIGWAFGIGLERIAMSLYNIPDIRLFWSTDSGFLHQFQVGDHNTPIVYKPVSIYPQCTNDLSFWIPKGENFSPNDFFDIAREVGGDVIEQILLVDEFTNPKTQQTSHCYRIIYRHMERNLTKFEVNNLHGRIGRTVAERFKVVIR
ncbi:probable phenylalanine--tRNA ligase, mitochondrial isoform X2 [Athalia rosae]|nr:probable phenylalanine--tRNA ligase, mitochondrial isoform X2 [Athalia rosae]XP_048507453.1 probable phenylalanine--tRNA ligase, mitochondrial isoform X2 [Athalia rosae]